jgi:phosphopantothenoylcysteine decarboxylase/phosphopantothenate--cysteine ligase
VNPAEPDPAETDQSPPRVIVGLSGGIACYKVASVVSALAQEGVAVTVAMTEAATRFVSPLTFQALSGRPVYTSPWQHVESLDPQHVDLARRADLMLIAPATMDLLARLATGRADDMVTLLAAAMDRARQPVLLAPSMNAVMYRQPSTQRNLSRLAEDGFRIIPPAEGWQACRTEGVGRLPEPEVLLGHVRSALRPAPRSGREGRSG